MTPCLPLRTGPHLFLDDHLIERASGVTRQVVQPSRFLDQPVVTSAADHRNWQPWFTVLRDPVADRFRLWYDVETAPHADLQLAPALGYLESADGVHWPGPFRRLTSVEPITFGACVVADGPVDGFKLIYFTNDRHTSPVPSGPRVAFSSDGLKWTQHNGGQPVLVSSIYDDSNHAAFDPIRQRYFLIHKVSSPYMWTNAEGQTVQRECIRRYGITFSRDFKTWSRSRIIFSPDAGDPGLTEWYGLSGFIVRGDLIVAFLTVLRDDLTAAGAPPEAVQCNMGNAGAGLGQTVLAWTRDGEHWERDRQADRFFEPDLRVGAWDHAVAWVESAVPVDDEVYLYYAGYRWGHKYQRKTDRQIGLVKTRRDRFVARAAGAAGGCLTTPLVTLAGDRLALNADAANGEVRVQVLDVEGRPVRGFTFAECRPITGDSLAASVDWNGSLAALRGQPVRLQIELRRAALFALELN